MAHDPSQAEAVFTAATFVAPQLASVATDIPAGPGWLFEEKYDGYRAQAVLSNGNVQIFTRNGLDWTTRFETVRASLQQIGCRSAIIDGEICALDAGDRSDFSRLCAGLNHGAGLTFMAFDLLERDGFDLTAMPQVERKRCLHQLLASHADATVRLAPYHLQGGRALFDQMWAAGREGIMAKRLDAPYRPGQRSPAWRKVKCTKRQEFVIAGWRSDSAAVRSLILATYEDGNLVYRGSVGTGFSTAERQVLHTRLLSLEVSTSGFEILPAGRRRRARWVVPELVAEIAFAEISAKGSVRHPAYLGLREDKIAGEVRLELGITEHSTR